MTATTVVVLGGTSGDSPFTDTIRVVRIPE